MKAREIYVQVPGRDGLYHRRRVTLPATGRDALKEQLGRLAKLAADVDELNRRLPPAKLGRRD